MQAANVGKENVGDMSEMSVTEIALFFIHILYNTVTSKSLKQLQAENFNEVFKETSKGKVFYRSSARQFTKVYLLRSLENLELPKMIFAREIDDNFDRRELD